MATPTRAARSRRAPAVASPALAEGVRATEPMGDPDGGQGEVHGLLTIAVAEAARLLDADGAMIYLLDPQSGVLRFAHDAGISSRPARERIRSIRLPVGVGLFGRAVVERAVVVTHDYMADSAFQHAADPDQVVRDIGIRSMVVAPMVAGSEVFGALGTFSSRADAFDPAQIGLVRALADHAAGAMRNARLIEALDESRRDLARAADAERTLREIAARITLLREPGEILQDVVEQAGRLVAADGVILDLFDPTTGNLQWALDNGLSAQFGPEERAKLWISVGVGATGIAVAEDRVIVADDDLAAQFPPSPESSAFYERTGFHSMIAAPISGDSGPLGVLEVYARERAAFDEDDARLVGALASQAAVAITNARLIEQLARSRGELARTADAERTLREIAGRVSAMHDQDAILQSVIDASVRLLGATGAMIDLLGDSGMAEAWTSREAGVRAVSNRDLLSEITLDPDAGVSGLAVRTRQVEWTGDYLEDDRFQHTRARDEFVGASGIHSVIAAPLINRDVVVGAITVYCDRTDAFGEQDAGLLAALADQAAVAIANVRLIEELERSRAEVARRADSERTLREIAARVSAILDPEVILDRVVEEARRLLGTDGAHLTRMSEDRRYLVPAVVAGASDTGDRAWLLSMEFPLGGGINGLAAQLGEAIWTSDYLADPRIPLEPGDVAVAERLALRGMAAAPLRAPGGEVIGTLAVSSARPRSFGPDELDLLQGLADQAAIAITNSNLLTRLTASEARYRYLVERAPDVVWSIGADARLTFVSDAVVRLTGRRPEELLGQHFGALVHESSRDVAEIDWTSSMVSGSQEVRSRLNLAGADGQPIPAEFIAAARIDESGRFLGANGSVRDMREHDRLEHELRESESRYRFLVENSPDIVFSTDAEGRFTFMADTIERIAGWRAEEVVGQHFSKVVDAGSYADATTAWNALASQPTVEQVAQINMRSPDGRLIPVEVSSIGMVDEDGRFGGIHGATREIGERARLEGELRRQAAELAAGEERAHLARELHDSVTQALFSMTLVSRSVELLLDRDQAAARTQLSQLRDLQREALAEMRALIFELRPGNLEEDGLTRALRTHTAAIRGRVGLPVVVESTLEERLPLAVEEVLYRIAQEALHNVVKHAGARQVRLEVGRTGNGVRLYIHDDGKGFEPDRVPDGHLGLAGMRARADKIGARFTCRSEPGQGTTIEVLVPEPAIAAAGATPGATASAAIRDA